MSTFQAAPLNTSLEAPLLGKVYIKTYGCQMNVYDSQRMESALLAMGFGLTENPHEARVMIVNTCDIRHKAEEKLFSDLGRLRKSKQIYLESVGHNALIVVAGCTAQALGEAILKRAPYVDVLVGPQTYHTLPDTLRRLLPGVNQGIESEVGRHTKPGIAQEKEHLSPRPVPSHDATFSGGSIGDVGTMFVRSKGAEIALGFPKIAKFDELAPLRASGPSAFLSIQEGCDKFCRYCVVPFTRGPEYSRPVADIVGEARDLVKMGAKEITLLGQNVNAYHGLNDSGTPQSLGLLLRTLGDIPGLARLRYMTSHPRDMRQDLWQAHEDIPAVMPFLHLPVQSGSDKVLEAMNRQYGRALYLDIIAHYRTLSRFMGFSSDFIVGYPGESDEDFQDTLDLVSDVGFAQGFSFEYSMRPGTPAANKVQVPGTIKHQRLQALQALLNQQRLTFNEGFLGKTVEMLIESVSTSTPSVMTAAEAFVGGTQTQACTYRGKSPWMQTVIAQGLPGFLPGQIVSAVIESTSLNSLKGRIFSS